MNNATLWNSDQAAEAMGVPWWRPEDFDKPWQKAIVRRCSRTIDPKSNGYARFKRNKAAEMLREAVALGYLRKEHQCFTCGSDKDVGGHHPDYDKPFDVVWLCKSCHTRLHRTSPGAGR